jgi:hypothetical protein
VSVEPRQVVGGLFPELVDELEVALVDGDGAVASGQDTVYDPEVVRLPDLLEAHGDPVLLPTGTVGEDPAREAWRRRWFE